MPSSPTRSGPTPHGRRIRVVIAEDDYGYRVTLRRLFSLLPMVDIVGEAEDGAEAVRLVKEQRPDAVLLDTNMPTMCGLEAAKLIGRKARIVLHSAFTPPRCLCGHAAPPRVRFVPKEGDVAITGQRLAAELLGAGNGMHLAKGRPTA